METRRRYLNGQISEDERVFQLEEDYHVDPAILKVWQDFQFEQPPNLDDLRRERLKQNGLNQNIIWFLMIILLGLLLFFANFSSTREMHRIKSETSPESAIETHEDHWWHHALIYHLFPRSFKDSNNDGIGDFNGIRSKIDHLVSLKVDAVLLDSIVASNNIDVARDPIDYMDVDPDLGSMQEFESLLKELHARMIKVILELIPNHTSDKHAWFQESRKGEGDKTDWYIWHEGQISEDGVRMPPNNWMSRNSGSAWTWDDMRKAYYFHQYSRHTPDLNHRHPHVRHVFLDVIKFWINKGVDGIMIDDMHTIFEYEDLTLDEPLVERPEDEAQPIPGTYESLEHVYTDDQPEMHEYLATWREYLDDYSGTGDKKIYLGARAVDDMNADIQKYYTTGVDAPVCPVFTHVTKTCDAKCVHMLIDDWLIEMPDGKTTLWQLSSAEPEVGRISSRRGSQYSGAFSTIQLLLPGASLLYYGDEIGMKNSHLSRNLSQQTRLEEDLTLSRDRSRTPMQWSDNDLHAGFSDSIVPWLRLDPQHSDINVKNQLSLLKNGSLLQLYKKLVKLRKEPSIANGYFKLSFTNSHMFVFLRFIHGSEPYAIIVNIGTEPWSGDISMTIGMDQGELIIYYHPEQLEAQAYLKEGMTVHLQELHFYPGEAFVIKLI